MSTSLYRRLLRDLAELQNNPYPNIALHVHGEDISSVCLVLTVEEYGRDMHLTVGFPHDYPLRAPKVHMDSNIKHPNIFGDYICASILNTDEGYTSAYTLKGIAIQLLSFFTSDKVEQEYGGGSIYLSLYRERQSSVYDNYTCRRCQFGMNSAIGQSSQQSSFVDPVSTPPGSSNDTNIGRNARRRRAQKARRAAERTASDSTPSATITLADGSLGLIQTMNIPDEILLSICEHLDTEELMLFAEAWGKIGSLMTAYDVIRTRELQCFCLKKDYTSAKLGVGVSVSRRGKFGFLESEFDLLSYEGYKTHRIRRSVQGVQFQYWLPLPISHKHWRNVQQQIPRAISDISESANLGNTEPVQVIFHFMNDIVVKLNQASSSQTLVRHRYYDEDEPSKSTLTHASEKAVESYFHLFHLLLCLVTSQLSIVKSANDMLKNFSQRGEAGTSKDTCPNLGYLLVAALISDVEMTENIMKPIVKEAVTRNVVWMLGEYPELSYYEPSATSHYRLQKTFEASKTSYRLLMFLNIFRKTAIGSPRKPLPQLRDEAFERHGAPPRGSAKRLAAAIRGIHRVNTFPDFLRVMDIDPVPTAAWFTNFLRDCVKNSMAKGYSKMPISQAQALTIRLEKEPGVAVENGFCAAPIGRQLVHQKAFFPNAGGRGQGNWRGRGGRGGGGGGRGGYR
jgi:ubiquitin-protein ligase